MKTDSGDRWICDLAIYETKDGPEFRFKDGRATMVEGPDAARNLASIAVLAVAAAEKAKAEADGAKVS
jgi:hypothetical protein